MSKTTQSTLAAIWSCSVLAAALILGRITLRKLIRHQSLDKSDWLCIISLPFLLARLALIHLVIVWGTNNMTAKYRKEHKFTEDEIWRREMGSKFVLATRFFYAAFVWIMKCVLLIFYHRLVKHTIWGPAVLKCAWFTLFASLMTVQVTTFTECRPFNHYWIVFPDPGRCCVAIVQLMVLGILSIFTDIMLIVLPIPVLVKLKQPLKQKIQLGGLFCVGFFVIGITAIRLPQNLDHISAQVNRSLWVSVEILMAAFVANSPTIYGLVRQVSAQREHQEYWQGGGASTVGQKSRQGSKANVIPDAVAMQARSGRGSNKSKGTESGSETGGSRRESNRSRGSGIGGIGMHRAGKWSEEELYRPEMERDAVLRRGSEREMRMKDLEAARSPIHNQQQPHQQTSATTSIPLSPRPPVPPVPSRLSQQLSGKKSLPTPPTPRSLSPPPSTGAIIFGTPFLVPGSAAVEPGSPASRNSMGSGSMVGQADSSVRQDSVDGSAGVGMGGDAVSVRDMTKE